MAGPARRQRQLSPAARHASSSLLPPPFSPSSGPKSGAEGVGLKPALPHPRRLFTVRGVNKALGSGQGSAASSAPESPPLPGRAAGSSSFSSSPPPSELFRFWRNSPERLTERAEVQARSGGKSRGLTEASPKPGRKVPRSLRKRPRPRGACAGGARTNPAVPEPLRRCPNPLRSYPRGLAGGCRTSPGVPEASPEAPEGLRTGRAGAEAAGAAMKRGRGRARG